MRCQSPEYERSARTAQGLMKALLVLSAMGLAGGGISQSAAQGAAADVAYVETVRGGVVASAQGGPTAARGPRYHQRSDQARSPGEQRTAYLSLPNAQGGTR